MIYLVIPGEPCGKLRARTFYDRRVGRVVSKTPEKTKNYETFIRELFAAKYTGFLPLAGAVRLRLNIYLFHAPLHGWPAAEESGEIRNEQTEV